MSSFLSNIHSAAGRCTRSVLPALLSIAILFLSPVPVSAAGSYAEGYVVVRIKKIEAKGWFIESYEGEADWATFNPAETCDETKDLCFTPVAQTFEFSVRKENGRVINLLMRNVDREIVFHYKIHRVEAAALSTSFEVLDAFPVVDDMPDVPDRIVGEKTGSKRRGFSVYGKILRLDYQGTALGTYEGLYLDRKKRKVHPFSISDPRIADVAMRAIISSKEYHMGISVAYATVKNKTNYDLFEINYNEEAGGVYNEEPAKKDPPKKDDKKDGKK